MRLFLMYTHIYCCYDCCCRLDHNIRSQFNTWNVFGRLKFVHLLQWFPMMNERIVCLAVFFHAKILFCSMSMINSFQTHNLLSVSFVIRLFDQNPVINWIHLKIYVFPLYFPHLIFMTHKKENSCSVMRWSCHWER